MNTSPQIRQHEASDPTRKQLAPMHRVVDALFEEMERVYGSDPSLSAQQIIGQVSELHLDSLRILFEKQLEKALKLMEEGRVTCYVGRESGRKVFRVRGDQSVYTVFPAHYCPCSFFQFSVVKNQQSFHCKHQLAARLAYALRQCPIMAVDEGNLIQFLDQPVSAKG